MRRLALSAVLALLLASAGVAAELTRFDFEDGTLQGWKIVTGEAGKLPTGPETARPDVHFFQQGKYFIGLFENPANDGAQIVLQSPTFTVRANTISLLVGGGDHYNETYIALYRASDNAEIHRATGANQEAMTPRYWDVSKLKGQDVYAKIVDAHTGGWGHINVDDIHEMGPGEERERVRQAAAKERRYEEWVANVSAPARRIVYTGKALQDLAMPIGGIGGGHISICGDGAIRQWQVFGKVNEGCVVPDSFFAVWARPEGGKPAARVLQQGDRDGMSGIKSVEFIGEYPVAEINYRDDALPVRVSLRAFSPYIPMNEKDSAIPAAVFEFAVENRDSRPVEVSLLSTLQNAAGYDGTSPIKGVWSKPYGGNQNTALTTGGLRGLWMSAPLMKPDERQYGTMALAATDPDARLAAQWNDVLALWREFSSTGQVSQAAETLQGPAGPSRAGRTWNGAVTVPLKLGPREKATVVFIWAWHFPNHYVWWDGREGQPKLGRMYSNWFKDAGAAADYVASNYERLSSDTEKFRRTFYKTTLPYWMLNRISAQSSTLVSTVCMWIEDGSFVAFEGSGCCPMNCTHVWNYEQQLAHLFPGLERNMRRLDYEVQQDPNGGVRHRTRLPLSLPRETGPFVDGHLGTILKSYREYRLSADRAWLDRMWPRIKKAMDFVLNEWDPNKDGVLVNEQWNTYDAAMYGPNTFIGTLYLAALRSAEEMAKVEGDTDYAAKLNSIYRTGRRRLDAVCWNGEYYQQIETKPTAEQAGANTWLLEDWPTERNDPNVNRPYGKGCHADQLLGQWWAHILDLGYVLPQDRVRSSLDAMMKHNWVTDFGEVRQWPRAFAGSGDPGLYICTWPNGGKPANETLYSFEVWTGIEHAVAGLMIYEDHQRDAWQIMKAAADRYDGVARPPIPRNPWADVECANHYARAMASWSIILAAQGFRYCGPEQAMAFSPAVSPENHSSIFTGAEGWGLFTQKRSSSSQSNTLKLEYGTLQLKSLDLTLARAVTSRLEMRVNGTRIDGQATANGEAQTIRFTQPLTLKAGDELRVTFGW